MNRAQLKITVMIVITALAWLALVFGVRAETCMASHYGAETCRGKRDCRTANGERFNPHGMTAAHRSAPFGSIIGVRAYGREIRVRINDRGPFVRGRCIDLADGAARALGVRGTALVEITRLR